MSNIKIPTLAEWLAPTPCKAPEQTVNPLIERVANTIFLAADDDVEWSHAITIAEQLHKAGLVTHCPDGRVFIDVPPYSAG